MFLHFEASSSNSALAIWRQELPLKPVACATFIGLVPQSEAIDGGSAEAAFTFNSASAAAPTKAGQMVDFVKLIMSYTSPPFFVCWRPTHSSMSRYAGLDLISSSIGIIYFLN